jgi:hypothetical protein
MDAADVADDKLIQWPAIPPTETVLQAILNLCGQRRSHS